MQFFDKSHTMENKIKIEAVSSRTVRSILDVIPVDSFPHIWKMILNNLTRPKDLRNASETCTGWKKIISRRKLWLFGKVVPFISAYLGRRDILNLREVCSAWSKAVDRTIKNAGLAPVWKSPYANIGMSIWNHKDDDFPYILGTDLEVDFPLDVDVFIEAMESHPRNPIVGRGVVVKDWGGFRGRAELLEQINRFLPIFGHYLHHIYLEFNEPEINLSSQSTLINTVLPNTPNLKLLRIGSRNCYFIDSPNENDAFQLPDLPKLRTLQLYYCGEEASPREFIIARDLVRKFCCQLTRFEVSDVASIYWSSVSWPNLEELHVTINDKCGILLSHLLSMDAPQLTKLLIMAEPGSGSFNLEELMQVQLHFPKLGMSGTMLMND